MKSFTRLHLGLRTQTDVLFAFPFLYFGNILQQKAMKLHH